MNNENSDTAKMPPSVAESAEKSEIPTDDYSTLKAERKDRGQFSKPKTLTEACATMKEEIKAEAKRLVPDLGNQH